MHLTLNAGIGDIILSHAMIDRSPEPERLTVSLDDDAIERYRTPEYADFAYRLAETLFRAPRYDVVRGGAGGKTPQQLSFYFNPAAPDCRSVLAPNLTHSAYVAVTTKVRGWSRHEYEHIREDFLELLDQIALRLPLVLVGEREIGWNQEYDEHGRDRVFSIYNDLCQRTCIDYTVPELGRTPPDWDSFLTDCWTLAAAERVVTLGSGGNVTLAMAVGRPLVLAGGTEMSDFFMAMPPTRRIKMFSSPVDYLEALRDLA